MSFKTIIIIIVLAFAYYIPLIDGQNGGEFFCHKNVTNSNLYCCPLLAHQMATPYRQSISIILINNSGYNMNLVVSNIESGSWVNQYNINCTPQTEPLANGQSEAFSSISSGYYSNTKGFVTFIMDDDISSAFTINWRVPIVNHSDYSVDFGDYTDFFSNNKYNSRVRLSLENTLLQITIHQASIIWIVLSITLPFFIMLCYCFLLKKSTPQERLTSRSPQSPQSYNSV